MLKNGTAAPDFTLTDDRGSSRSLYEIRQGKPLALLFFRGAFCPTALRDLVDYADVYSRMKGTGAELAGISAESPASGAQLIERLRLPFSLLSDEGLEVSRQYGVYESEDGEGPQPHGEPALFILDVDGRIAYSQVMTGPKGIANPSEATLILHYMSQNGGRY